MIPGAAVERAAIAARVVIIDDSATGRMLMRHLLNASGVFSVIGEAADGRQGIELATTEQPDVILLDFAMPVMDGLEALPQLVSAVPGALVIMLSGFGAQDSAHEALALGAHAYLEKNERPDDLLRRIVDLYQAFAAPAGAGETSVDLAAQARHDQFRLTDRPLTGTDSELVRSDGDFPGFAAVAAHDLKSTLHLILGFSALLDRTYRDRLDDHGHDLIASIVAGAEHMEGQIEGLLRYCRLETAPRSVEPVDLEDLLADTLAIFGPEVAQISVEDNPTGGSRCLATIPDLGSYAGREEPAPAPSTTALAPPASPLKVLLVEDSPPHAKLIAALLARAPAPGYRVRQVATLAEALVALTTTEVDCVLLDLSLPDARDLEGVVQVTSTAPLLPVVVITSSTDEAQAFAAVKEGAQDYLVKGHIDVEHLSRSIRWAVQRKALETELAHDALHDGLTGLPNRTLMVDRLRSALARTARSGTKVGVFYLDLDGFKPVNDRLGHDAGDRVLIMVADRMRSAVRPQDTVARIGGDEFVVISEGFSSSQEPEVLRTRLAITLAAPLALDGHTLQVTASIGLAVGDHQATVEGLLHEADLAMYEAKHARP